MGILVILRIFSRAGLQDLWAQIAANPAAMQSDNAKRIYAQRDRYSQTIEAVIAFLQGKAPTMAHLIAQGGYLPQAKRLEQARASDTEWAFGIMGTQDHAKHLATLYLEDIGDIITECIDPHFGFSRYAERLGRCANQFDELYAALQADYTYIDRIHIEILQSLIADSQPQLVGFSVPFPGNLYSAFRAAQWIKLHHPQIKVAMGGGFANTELRSLNDKRVMEFFDYISLDDGEAPLECMLELIEGKRPADELKRTFSLNAEGDLAYIDRSGCGDYSLSDTGTPDYSDLPLDKYISVIEIANPMHRIWSDGRWNKLTMAHGCYWGKCTFCDISLDYIKNYEPIAAQLLCERMETLIAETGERGFHFVDEAAPPALMRAMAIEILRRGLVVTWWANIRFEKSFSADLCRLLKASGCIAVSGGLEVASDRLLELIQKGVTVAQVAVVCQHFTDAGIMVHAYLMYGFPTQTAQETIDSLEMVRQLFESGVLQSGFWHQFAMTAHSPVGMQPEKFKVQAHRAEQIGFADNDIEHSDPTGTQHELFSEGLRRSLFNYMQGLGFDMPLRDWFEHRTPATRIARTHIADILAASARPLPKPTHKVLYIGLPPLCRRIDKTKRGRTESYLEMQFFERETTQTILLPLLLGEWLRDILPRLSPAQTKLCTIQELEQLYNAEKLDEQEDFTLFWYNKPVGTLRELLLL